MGRHSDNVRVAIQTLRRQQQAHRAQRQAIAEDPRYSDTYKCELIAQLVTAEEAQLRALAKGFWKETQSAKEALTAELSKARAMHNETYDYAKLSFMAQRYKALVSGPADPMSGDSPASRIDTLYREAQQMGDREAQRALRTVGLELLANVPFTTGTAGQLARDLYRQIRHDEANDVLPDGFQEMQADLEGVDVLSRELRSEIRQTETAITGASGDVFSSVTPWAADIFGESHADHIAWRKPDMGPTDLFSGGNDDDGPNEAA